MNVFWKSPKIHTLSTLILVAGLLFFAVWLANYSWTIVKTPYPAEYREGAIVLLTDFFIRGENPFSLENHPLMTNNYGFLYNLLVLPFAATFGNTLQLHRAVSIFFNFASCILVFLNLRRAGVSRQYALAASELLMASLLFGVTPLARPDALGVFLFLLAVLLPWYRNFDRLGLVGSGLASVLAFLAKPYFILSVGIVSAFTFLFVSKKKSLLYVFFVSGLLLGALYAIRIYFECYYLDTVLNNMANTSLSPSHMQDQLLLFVKTFFPGLLILLLGLRNRAIVFSSTTNDAFHGNGSVIRYGFDQPLLKNSINYFVFFLQCTLIVVVAFLGQHLGAYMSYFFQLVAPGLLLVIFQNEDVLRKNAIFTVPLVLINLYIICFFTLYPNQLSTAEERQWEKLYGYLVGPAHIFNSPVQVTEMVRLGHIPVDSGQTEYYFRHQPYVSAPFAPEYALVLQRGQAYMGNIRNNIQSQRYVRIFVTPPGAELGFSAIVDYPLINQFYEPIDSIPIAMPQTDQHWTIEIYQPKTK